METRQQTILHVLEARQIDYDTIDISAPGNQELRKFMRERGKKINGQRNALPPQIFNGEEHRFSFILWRVGRIEKLVFFLQRRL